MDDSTQARLNALERRIEEFEKRLQHADDVRAVDVTAVALRLDRLDSFCGPGPRVSSLRPQVAKFWGVEVRQNDPHDSRDSEP